MSNKSRQQKNSASRGVFGIRRWLYAPITIHALFSFGLETKGTFFICLNNKFQLEHYAKCLLLTLHFILSKYLYFRTNNREPELIPAIIKVNFKVFESQYLNYETTRIVYGRIQTIRTSTLG